MENNKNESHNRKHPPLSKPAFYATSVNQATQVAVSHPSSTSEHHQLSNAASTTSTEGMIKQLFCGGIAGAVAKTVTAPFSRLTILFQVHSMVTTRENRPFFAMSLTGGMKKIIDRGGVWSLWRGNGTSVLHRFPYSAINFFVYEHTLDYLEQRNRQRQQEHDANNLRRRANTDYVDYRDEKTETSTQLAHRVTQRVFPSPTDVSQSDQKHNSAWDKFVAGAAAGSIACVACYPLDLVRTRLTTELEGKEHYRGMVDAFRKIAKAEGISGFYSGIGKFGERKPTSGRPVLTSSCSSFLFVGPTLALAVPNFAISYSVYGTLKEYALDDELFYNLRRIDAESGEPKLGLLLTVLCGAASGCLATCVTFPMDTIRRRMQIQNLHVPPEQRLSSHQQFVKLVTKEGLASVYRGLTPELLKVIPMVGTMFVVYEFTKELLNVRQ